MKHSKKSKLLALVLVVCMALSMTVPAMAADDWSGSATASDFDWGSSLQRFFGSVAGAFRGKGGSTPGLTPIAPGEGGETGTGEGSLTLIENETTVTEGTNLRSDTYVLNSADINATSGSTTMLKYFPVTLYNYDKTTINNATHQVEVDGGLGNTWNGIYFNDGNPSAESYTYSTGGEVSYTSTTVNYSNNNNYNTYINNGYYVDVNGTKYLVTGLSCTRSGSWWNGYTYSWTITYSGGTATSSDSSITLYKASDSSTITTGSLSYAAWNFWNKGAGNNDYGQYTYSGLVESTLDANKNITFTKPDGGIFNSDATVKDIYTGVELPFVYENGTYTFDASVNGAYFYADSTQGSTAAQSNGRLYFDEANPQSWDGMDYGDGSKNLWAPFNENNLTGEGSVDYHFGMRATIPFTMTANGKMNPNDDYSEDITFSFSGDDDVWIFIDGQLVIDLGGIHNRLDATINFAENTWSITESNNSNVAVADYNDAAISGAIFNDGDTIGVLNQTRETFAATDSHELTIFYLERGGGSSNNKIQFNLPMKDTLSVTKRITQSKDTQGELSPLTPEEQAQIDNVDFGFTLYKDGDAVANTTYSLLNANGQVIATPSTDANGHFTLRNGQTAKFVGVIDETDGSSYYVVEDTKTGYVTPDYTYTADVANGANVTAGASGWTSMTVKATGSDEAEDRVAFTCENYLSEDLPNPGVLTENVVIVLDYGLPVEIAPLVNDVWRGESIELVSVGGAPYYGKDDEGNDVITGNAADPVYGTLVKNGDNVAITGSGTASKFTYQLTQQLTGVEVLTYGVQVTGGNTTSGVVYGLIYIVPATSMYYEEDFAGLVTFSEGWTTVGTAQTDPQEPGVVGTVGDSPYGSDAAYLNDSGDSNGSSKYVDTTSSAASFSYTFTGTGTSFFARTTNNSGYMRVIVTDASSNVVKTLYRDTSYKTDNDSTTLYNIPVFTCEGLDYGTYTVTVSIAGGENAGNYGREFWLDGIRVVNPLDMSITVNKSVADYAYSADGEANMMSVTLREKLITEAQINEDDTISWNEGDNFVIFTDSNDKITSAEEYRSNGPKEEVYLDNGQSVTFSLTDWDANTNKVYLGIKAPFGSGSVSINGNAVNINNAVDCYYDITGYASITTDEDGVKTATFEIEATSSLISVTNIKVTGNAKFTIINQEDPSGDNSGDEDVTIDG